LGDSFVLRGFTLVELLVVIGIISLLLGILSPVLSRAKRKAKKIINISNQRQIVMALTMFADDNSDQFPESVATIGTGSKWHWQEPTMLTGYLQRSPKTYRSLSSYLSGYVEDASVFYCPGAPKEYEYLDEAWAAGESWDNPETPAKQDSVTGSYCFYWNYKGYLKEDGTVFKGPTRARLVKGESGLMVSDYFGYDHRRSVACFGSCEKMQGSGIVPAEEGSSSYWSLAGDEEHVNRVEVTLTAGFVDGRVESYTPEDVVPMEVAKVAGGSVPYPRNIDPCTPHDIGPGIFYLPESALKR